MKNFASQTEPLPLSFPPPVQQSAQQRVDPNSHNLNWYNQPTIEQFNFYPDPPAVDMSMSLFDHSEQQYLSGFFDNLVEDKNEFILPTNLDFSALLSSWGGPNQFSDHQPKSHLQSYGIPPHQPPQQPYFQTGRAHLPSVGFHNSLPYSTPDSHLISHNYLQAGLKFQTPCDPLSSMSDNGSNKPLCNIRDNVSQPVYGNFNIGFQPTENTSPPKNITNKRVADEPQKLPTAQSPVRDEQRKANHIASEQKRRDIIRRGYEQLTELVPCLRGNHCSKATILTRAADYMEEVEQINRELQKQRDLLRGQSSGTSSTSSFPLTPGHNFHDNL